MAKYIDCEAAVKFFLDIAAAGRTSYNILLLAVARTIAALPAADVRPVVKAHWYWDKDGMDWGIGAWRCSACNTMPPMWWNCDKGSPMHKSGHNYCPNCGADMR